MVAFVAEYVFVPHVCLCICVCLFVFVEENLLESGSIWREVSCRELLRKSTQALSRVCALLTLRQSSITLLHQKCHHRNNFHSSFSSSRSSWQTSGKVYSSPFGSLACYRRFFYSYQAQNLFHYPHHYWKSSLQFEYLVVRMMSTSLILYVIFFPRTLGSLSNYNTRSKGQHPHL